MLLSAVCVCVIAYWPIQKLEMRSIAVLQILKHTRLLITAVPRGLAVRPLGESNPVKYSMTAVIFLAGKLHGHLTESHQIFTRCRQVTAN